MDRFRQKSKKEKPLKYVDKEQSPLFITDVKAIKENLKIKEILRTVKMNSSMRIKAPRGSKVMQNKDFNDNEDIFGGEQNTEDQINMEPPSATNPDVVVTTNNSEETEETSEKQELEVPVDKTSESDEELIVDDNENNNSTNTQIHESISVPEALSDFVLISDENKQNIQVIPDVKIDLPPPSECPLIKARDRKLSLDQTMLSRRGGLSQSELDLNSIGKSPLERKSSFFRKKMDSFLKNTTEIFKRQSSSRSQTMQRRGSMSVSLQSLTENAAYNGDYGIPLHNHQEELQRSVSSLQSSPTPARTGSSLSMSQSEQTLPDPQSEGNSLAGSRPVLTGSQPLGDTSPSVHSLNETYIQEAMLNRAISMSSGLDSASGQNRRKSRSNRVTWLASEGLTNYLRRITQDEKSREMNAGHSYQDFSTIPENNSESNTDSKGRRLSYQRAVSGEDPRYHESVIKKKQLIPESSELPARNLNTPTIAELLADFSRNGIPDLKGFTITNIPDEAYKYLEWAESPKNLEEFIDWRSKYRYLPPGEEARQAVIKELINTEADYIHHLLSIVQIFIATAHALQDAGKLLDIDTERLFTNIPDILNASLSFWENALYPMIAQANEGQSPFNTEIMAPGFMHFRDLFLPYEKYVNAQTKALDYLRSLANHSDFMYYLSWCYRRLESNRLQLADIMVKPMQRLTKYSLLLRRIIAHTDTEPERTSLKAMETCAKNYVSDLNRSIRQREELEKMDQLSTSIETYEIDFRDEELDRCYRVYAQINLKAPMVNCSPNHSRTLVHQGDLRYKDNIKEMDVRVFLLTDMLLICKKQSKGSYHPFKLVRQKYFLEKLIIYPRVSQRNPKEVGSLLCVVLDDVGSSCMAFSLSETSKDSNTQNVLKCWEHKLREARLTYELAVWFSKNPSRDLSEMEIDTSSDYGNTTTIPSASRPGTKQSTDELNIDREARERVAAMLHRSMGISTEGDFSQVSLITDSFDAEGAANQGKSGLRHPMKRNSTGGSSRNSRLSSFQQSSAASHDEPQAGTSKQNYKAGSSVEHHIPPQHPEDAGTSITVNVVSDSEETVVPVPKIVAGTTSTVAPAVALAAASAAMPVAAAAAAAARAAAKSGVPAKASATIAPVTTSAPPAPARAAAAPATASAPPAASRAAAASAVASALPAAPRPAAAPAVASAPPASASPSPQPTPPMLVLQHPSPNKPPQPSRSPSSGRNTLRVQPQNVVMALVNSLPDLTIDTGTPRPQQTTPSPQSASDKLYQSHQELLLRNRLSAQQQQHQHYLTPDHRGTSYPPPSPTRASLKRGLAFSYSFKNPPLSKMGHVNSQQAEAGPSTSQGSKADKGESPGTSMEKTDKKSKNVNTGNKSGSVSPVSRKEDKGD